MAAHKAELKEHVLDLAADEGSRIAHPVALAIIRGDSPRSRFCRKRGFTLRQLAESCGVTAPYISEIERGIKPGSMSALTRLADAPDARINVLAMAFEGRLASRQPVTAQTYVENQPSRERESRKA